MDINTILIGAAGGAIVLMAEQIYLFVREKSKEKKQKVVRFPNIERIIDSSIFDSLGPGSSIEFMKNVLGVPNKIYKEYDAVYETFSYGGYETDLPEVDEPTSDPQIEGEARAAYELQTAEENENFTYGYFYIFKNAYLKITSKDKETIDSISVNVIHGVLSTKGLPLGWSENEDENGCVLGLSKVTKELVDSCLRHEYRQTRFGDTFIFTLYTGYPFYTHYTYFGVPNYENVTNCRNVKPEQFIGSLIDGICLHSEEFNCYIVSPFDTM